MPTHDEHILRILAEATKPLFASEITDRMNDELGGITAYTMSEILTRLQGLSSQVTQLTDGRWILKPRPG